jgi:hypothetical protein
MPGSSLRFPFNPSNRRITVLVMNEEGMPLPTQLANAEVAGATAPNQIAPAIKESAAKPQVSAPAKIPGTVTSPAARKDPPILPSQTPAKK